MRDDEIGGGDAEIGPSARHLVDGVELLAVGRHARADIDVDPGSGVIALPECGIVTGELELVVPAELQNHLFLRGGARRGAPHQGGEENGGGEYPGYMAKRGKRHRVRLSCRFRQARRSAKLHPVSAMPAHRHRIGRIDRIEKTSMAKVRRPSTAPALKNNIRQYGK